MLFNKKFDLIISIGEDCACSSYLRRFGLQVSSYPFDWLTCAPFENRINLLCNNFERFLEFEDLKFLPKKNPETSDKNCDYYENTYNQIYFYHDFPTGVELKDSFISVKEKYQRRISRLYKDIENSSDILLVWWSRDKHIPDETYIESYEKLKNKFKDKRICLLAIEYKDTNKYEYKKINNNLMKISFDNISYLHHKGWGEVLGNEKNNNKIFKQIKKNLTLQETLSQIIYNFILFFIKLLPIKKLRQSLKNNLKKEFFHAAL